MPNEWRPLSRIIIDGVEYQVTDEIVQGLLEVISENNTEVSLRINDLNSRINNNYSYVQNITSFLPSYANVISDWNVSDTTSASYILNKEIVTDELSYLRTAYEAFKTEYDDDNYVISTALTDLDSRITTLSYNSFSGDYNDLTNKPTIPTLVQADWNQTIATALDYIKNKPDKYDIMDDLSSILSNNNDLIYIGDMTNASIELRADGGPNDDAYEIKLQINDGDSAIRMDTFSGLHITDYTNDHLQFNDLDIAFKSEIVQSDWNISDDTSLAYIKNKPTFKTVNNESLVGSGNVVISGLPQVSASDNGKILMVVNGQWQLVSPSVLYTGQGIPNNAQGNNGDIYMQTD